MTILPIILLFFSAIVITIIIINNSNTDKTRKAEPVIGQYYFNNVNAECLSIRSFLNKLANDTNYLKRMETVINGEIEVGDNKVTETWDKLRFYLLADLLRCQRGLNRPFVLKEPENLGFMLVSLYLTDVQLNITHKEVELCYEKCLNSINGLLKPIHDSLPSQENVFLIEHSLKGYDQKLHEEYVRHLYLFTSLITQFNNTTTASEKEWLDHLMALKASD